MGVATIALGAALLGYTWLQQSTIAPFVAPRPWNWANIVRALMYLVIYVSSFLFASLPTVRLLAHLTRNLSCELGIAILVTVGVWGIAQMGWNGTQRDGADKPLAHAYPFVLLSQAMEAYAIGLGVVLVGGSIWVFALLSAIASLLGLAIVGTHRAPHRPLSRLASIAAMSGALLMLILFAR